MVLGTRVTSPGGISRWSEWALQGEETGVSFTFLSGPFSSRRVLHVGRAVRAAEGVDLHGSLKHKL